MNNHFGEELSEQFGGQPEAPPREPAVAKLVGQMLEATPFKRDRPGNVYRYTGAYWEELSAPDLDHLAFNADPKTTSGHRRSEIVKLLGACCHDMAFSFGHEAGHEVAFENGVLDVRTGRLRAHRAEDYLESVLPWVWDAKAFNVKWHEALDDYFGEASEDGRHAALQEFAGYICLSSNKFKRALFLWGAGDTAKSLIVDVLAAIVGFERTSQLALEHMDDPKMRGVIKGKRLNVATEVSGRALIADAGFKVLVAGDPVLIDRKFKHQEMYRPIAKHVIAANSLPALRGRAAEVFSRFIILPLDRVFLPSEQDKDLTEKVLADMPGVLAWAIAGARRLLENGGLFTAITASSPVLDEWEAEVNPMRDFIREWMVKSEYDFTSLQLITEQLRRQVDRPEYISSQ